MKKLNLSIIVILLMVGLFSCKKDTIEQQTNEDEMMIRSKKVIARIQNFEQKMNDALKSGETITLDSAIWNMEASLNYNYADPEEAVGEYTFSKSNYTLEVDANGEVSMGDVQQLYTDMEQDLDNSFKSGDETVVIFSDVALDSITGGTAYLSGTNGYSSGIPVSNSPFGEDDDWIWGTEDDTIYPLAGKCDGSMVGVSDASNEIEWHLNNPISTSEPPFFTDIETVVVTFMNCWYNEPPQVPRVYHRKPLIEGDDCIENDSMTFYYDAAEWIIFDYNDVSNDLYPYIKIEDGEGARPVGKDFILIEIEDYFHYLDQLFYHHYNISYGIPNVAPTD